MQIDLPAGTVVRTSPREVEFRTPTPRGTLVVKVWLGTSMPRIGAWTLVPSLSGHPETVPLTLFLDEVVSYVNKALESVGLNERMDLLSIGATTSR